MYGRGLSRLSSSSLTESESPGARVTHRYCALWCVAPSPDGRLAAEMCIAFVGHSLLYVRLVLVVVEEIELGVVSGGHLGLGAG